MRRAATLVVIACLSSCLVNRGEVEEVACVDAPATSCPLRIASGERGLRKEGYLRRPDGGVSPMDSCDTGAWQSVSGAFPSGKYQCCYIVRGGWDATKHLSSCQD